MAYHVVTEIIRWGNKDESKQGNHVMKHEKN
jgi:hypothetical protein